MFVFFCRYRLALQRLCRELHSAGLWSRSSTARRSWAENVPLGYQDAAPRCQSDDGLLIHPFRGNIVLRDEPNAFFFFFFVLGRKTQRDEVQVVSELPLSLL
jgi:hypothetical protein